MQLAAREWWCALAEGANWLKRGQYSISTSWSEGTNFPKVQIGQNKVSIETAAHGMALLTN